MSSESPLTARPENLAEPLAWLPARAHGALPDDVALRGWLRDPGSLTSRLRTACTEGFRLELLGEAAEPLPVDAQGLLEGATVRARRVRMFCGDTLCVCATTLIPLPTLAGTEWLEGLGDRPLGDALLAREGIRRSAFEFARVGPAHPLFLPALQGLDIRPAAIWTRRSRFSLAAGPLLVYEMFLPGLTRCGTP